MDLQEFCKWFNSSEKETEMNVDYNLVILVCLVIMLNTDNIGGDLVQKKDIDALHLKYTNLLWKYLKDRSRNANAKFHKGLMLTVEAEEAYRLGINRLPI